MYFQGRPRKKNTGGSNITAYGVENITNLFMHIYRNIKGSVRTLHQFPGGNYATATTGETNYTKN